MQVHESKRPHNYGMNSCTSVSRHSRKHSFAQLRRLPLAGAWRTQTDVTSTRSRCEVCSGEAEETVDLQSYDATSFKEDHTGGDDPRSTTAHKLPNGSTSQSLPRHSAMLFSARRHQEGTRGKRACTVEGSDNPSSQPSKSGKNAP